MLQCWLQGVVFNGSDVGLRKQDAAIHQNFAFTLNQTAWTRRGRKWWVPNITVTLPSPTEGDDCNSVADGLLVLVPPAKVDVIAPSAVCEGDVQTFTASGTQLI